MFNVYFEKLFINVKKIVTRLGGDRTMNSRYQIQ